MGIITDLPAELKLDIFERIPAREVQRCRRVCKDFRDTIDANTSALSRDICTREVARLKAKIDYVFDYDPSQVTFSEALRRWCNHRGMCDSAGLRQADVKQFGEIYFLKNWIQGGLQHDINRPDWPMRREDLKFEVSWAEDEFEDTCLELYLELAQLATVVQDVFGDYHSLVEFELYEGDFEDCEDFADTIDWRLLSQVPGIDREWVKSVYNAAVHPIMLFDGPFRSRRPQRDLLMKLRPITKLNTTPFLGTAVDRVNPRGNDGVIAISELMRIFGTPFLPWQGIGAGTVAYCVKSKWADEAMSRDTVELEVLAFAIDVCDSRRQQSSANALALPMMGA
ncbi:hypothetical protein HII31_03439 [Pseudocercospora fuligena]|uniref:F-box domain-containing protein n=1 Tax=Pseudocercospora fuligena TaxID=685502 RepID=A0A8H6RQT9_9PEZI|nr:hypothetical protein HII31_03439 [Pseudocercospora fuligena]